MSDWDIRDIEPDMSWLDKMDKTCPFCKRELKITPGTTSPDIGNADCECGFSATFNAPDDLSPLKGVIKEIRL